MIAPSLALANGNVVGFAAVRTVGLFAMHCRLVVGRLVVGKLAVGKRAEKD